LDAFEHRAYLRPWQWTYVDFEEVGGVNANREFPQLRQVVLDCTDARTLAEFYRQLLGLRYRPGDEPSDGGGAGTTEQDWLVLHDADGQNRVAFQQVAALPKATWPDGPIRSNCTWT
jgi:Glyoxalase-like domain